MTNKTEFEKIVWDQIILVFVHARFKVHENTAFKELWITPDASRTARIFLSDGEIEIFNGSINNSSIHTKIPLSNPNCFELMCESVQTVCPDP